jgi:MFS family permease
MSAITAPRRDVRVISLIGIAHGTSHYYQLAFVTMLLIMRERVGLSFEQIGLLGGMFYGVSGLAQTGAGFAVDRFGARPILAGGLAMIGIAMGLISMAHSFLAFAVIAVIAGLGNSIFHPADFALINASVNPARLGRAFSIHGLGGSLGWAAAPVMYFLNDLFGPSGAALVGAVPGLLLASLIWAFRNDFVDHRVAARARATKGNDPSPLSLFLQGPILLCLGYFALVAASSVGIQQFAVPAWHSMFGVSESFAALCLVVYVVGSAAGVFVGGFFADRVRHHDRVAAIGLLLAATFTVPVATQNIPVFLLMPLLAAAGFSSGMTGPSRDMIVRGSTPPGASGKVFGFVYSGLDIGSFLAPPVFGWLMSHGVPAIIFWIAVGLYIVNAGLVMAILQSRTSNAVPAAAE